MFGPSDSPHPIGPLFHVTYSTLPLPFRTLDDSEQILVIWWNIQDTL